MKKRNLFSKKISGDMSQASDSLAPKNDALDMLLQEVANVENAELPLADIRKKINAQIGAELVMLAKSAPRGTTAAAATVADISDTGFQMTEITLEKAEKEAEERAAQKAAEEEARAMRQKAVSEAEMRAAIAAAAAAGTPLAPAVPAPTPAPTPKASALADETARIQAQAATQDTDSAVSNVKAAKAAAKAAKENAKLAQQNAKKAKKAARKLALEAAIKDKTAAVKDAATAKEPKPVKAKPEQKKAWPSIAKLHKAKREARLEQEDQDELRMRRLQKPAEEAPKKRLLSKKMIPYASAAAGVLVLCVAAFALKDSILLKTDMAAPAAEAPAEAMLTYDMAVMEQPAAEPAAPATEESTAETAAGATAENDSGNQPRKGEAMQDSGLLESGAEIEGSLEMMLLAADADYVCYGTLTDNGNLMTWNGDMLYLDGGKASAPANTECLFFLALPKPDINTYTVLKAFPTTANDDLAKEAFILFPYPTDVPAE